MGSRHSPTYAASTVYQNKGSLMVNIPALQNVLLSMASDLRFQLDNRDALSILQFIEKYTKSVPYEDDSAFESWADFLFMDNNTPEVLAQLYHDPNHTDGTLQPHQAFLLAMLTMMEVPQTLFNYYPYAHRNLYYRDLLGLEERSAQASKVAVAVNLSKGVEELRVVKGTRLSAGQDEFGHKLEFSLDDDIFANQSHWSHCYWCYPREEGGAYTSRVFDDKQEWPKNGVRLFDNAVERTRVLTGRVVSSEAFVNEDKEAMTLMFTFSRPVEVSTLRAEISGKDGWVSLTIETLGTSDSLVCRLSSGEEAASGEDVDMPYSVPVVRLSREDGKSLDEVQSLSVDGHPVSAFSQSILTPFGVSDYEHPITDMQIYIGVDTMKVGQTLSLFWHLNSPQMLSTTWEYLSAKGQWESLESDLIDRTKGLSSQGEWSVVLPETSSDETTVMPSGAYWVRARITPIASISDTHVYPWLSGLIVNAMSATLVEAEKVADSFFAEPLAPNTISKPVQLTEGVKGFTQPWISWQGRVKESSLAFFTRIQRQLSHRQRALTWPDMVTLLKTEFPNVLEALTPSEARLTRVPAFKEQALIVLPRAGEQDNDDPLRPMFNAEKLAYMTRYLQALASQWQTPQVVNATYRNVFVSYDVTFKQEVNINYADKQLKKAISDHYMPWASGQSELSVGNTLDYYDLVAHIQRHPFVKHVHNLFLNGSEQSIQGDEDEVLIIQWAE
nr:hypothetical protein [Vibrio cyclitrophicus]